jgi:outer membrane protein OmpA-like peptidoglycan-associated protein
MIRHAVAISMPERRRAVVGLCLALGIADLGFIDAVVIPRVVAGPRVGGDRPGPAPIRAASAGMTAAPVADVPMAQPAPTPTEVATFPALVIHFQSGQSLLTPQSRAAVDGLARRLARGGARVSVEGHADARGELTFNQRLSRERARVVARRLEARGLDQRQVALAAFGATRPAADGSDPAALGRNRRVEFVILRGAP